MKTSVFYKLLLVTAVLFFSAAASVSNAQRTESFDNVVEQYKEGKGYFDLALYGQAHRVLKQFIDRYHETKETKPHLNLFTEASTMYHVSEMRLRLPSAETHMRDFIQKNYPNPLIVNAVFELADFYYNEKRYAECIEYFEMIDIDAIPEIRMSELVFKKGYCHFVRKEFQKAQLNLSYSRDIKNKFFYPINYYYGMAEYFTNDYKGAVQSFQRLEGSSVYRTQIPYNIAQIYFAQGEYDKLFSYAEAKIQEPDVKKIREMRLLLGQAYFLRKDYSRALPHLEYYESNTEALTVEEFYQLAFTQYKLDECAKAIENFEQISLEETKIGQMSSYYMADCYLKLGDKNSARASFKKVSQMDYDKGMNAEAVFNYGKLSAEMGFEREAINTLIATDDYSPYKKESNQIINDILVNTSDYVNATEIIESLSNLSPELKRTYQDISFKQGLKFYNDGNQAQALSYFGKAKTYPVDNKISAQIAFWEASLLADERKYKDSNEAYDSYLSLAQGQQLPFETSAAVANYNIGYNHLKMKEYPAAARAFATSIEGLEKYQDARKKAIADRLLGDAYLRAGDSYFKERKLDLAANYYEKAAEKSGQGQDYALYQKGLIEGLAGKNYEKIITMERLTTSYPSSPFADDALLQTGDAYLALGNNNEAAASFQLLANKYQGKSNLINNAYLKLGLIYYNAGDANGALGFYKNVFTNNPNGTESQEALLAIEEIYIDDLQDPDGYSDYLAKIPGYEISSFQKDSLNYYVAENQYANANYEDAINAFSNYLSKYPQGYYRIQANFYSGECLSILKKYGKALTKYEAVMNEGFNDFYMQSLRKAALISYNHSLNFDKALTYYKQLETKSDGPEDKFEAQLGAMRSAFRLGRDLEVLDYAGKVKKNPLTNPDDRLIAHYYSAKANYRKRQYQPAYQDFEVASTGSNNQAAESRYMLAQVQFDQGNYAAAETAVNAANELNGGYPKWIAKSLLLLSKIYIKNDDLLNARAATEAVKENFKNNAEVAMEADSILVQIETLETQNSRVKTPNQDGTLELDTTGGN